MGNAENKGKQRAISSAELSTNSNNAEVKEIVTQSAEENDNNNTVGTGQVREVLSYGEHQLCLYMRNGFTISIKSYLLINYELNTVSIWW